MKSRRRPWPRSCSRHRHAPRQVLPRQFYLITRRCTQREFLLRPDPAINNAFLYCLIAAALRCEIEVLLPCAMSNHYHAVIYDPVGWSALPAASWTRARSSSQTLSEILAEKDMKQP